MLPDASSVPAQDLCTEYGCTPFGCAIHSPCTGYPTGLDQVAHFSSRKVTGEGICIPVETSE